MSHDDKKIRVVGTGLIASNVREVFFPEKTLIIASGVSNSKETRLSEFNREEALVRREILTFPDSRIIYFSTCSISSGENSAYIQHKLNMENLVRQLGRNYWIFRLPQVVGAVNNLTLVSYLFNSIKTRRKIFIQEMARRNLIDIEDAVRIASLHVLESPACGSTENIASSRSVPVLDIVKEISRLLGIPAIYELKQEGYGQNIDIASLRDLLSPDDPIFERDYWKKILLKYSSFYKTI